LPERYRKFVVPAQMKTSLKKVGESKLVGEVEPAIQTGNF
jgi:hypothetical protein